MNILYTGNQLAPEPTLQLNGAALPVDARLVDSIRAVLAIVAIVAACLVLAGCSDTPARSGSAQAAAAGAQARAVAAASAVDQADQAAALAAGRAAGATEAAKADPTTARIAAAVEARVEAASTAAVAAALHAQEAGLRAAASAAQSDAEAERQRDADAQACRAWTRLCRVLGLAGIVGGCLVGAAVAWLAKAPRLGSGIAVVLGATGALVIAIGPATAWLPWLLTPASLAALGAWAWRHRREIARTGTASAAAIAGSRAVDAVEKEVGAKSKAAKVALGEALTAAGLAKRVAELRGPARLWDTP